MSCESLNTRTLSHLVFVEKFFFCLTGPYLTRRATIAALNPLLAEGGSLNPSYLYGITPPTPVPFLRCLSLHAEVGVKRHSHKFTIVRIAIHGPPKNVASPERL